MAGLIYNIIAAKKILPQNSIIRCLYVCSAVMFISVVLAAVYSDYFTSVYILYLMWLMVMASVDYYTGYVYVKMEYAVIVPVILCIISLFNTSYNKEHIEALAISVCIISALLKISSKAGWFGEGDSDVLICSSVFCQRERLCITERFQTLLILLWTILLQICSIFHFQDFYSL